MRNTLANREQAMNKNDDIADIMGRMKDLIGKDDGNTADFVAPSLLREVPSFTSSDSVTPAEVKKRAELGGRT